MGKRDKKKKRDKQKGTAAAKAETRQDKAAKKSAKKQKDNDEDDIEQLIAEFKKKDAEKTAVTESLNPPPAPRMNATFLPVPNKDNEFILYGGESFEEDRVVVYSDLFRYNLKRTEWKKIESPNSPAPRCSHQAVCSKNFMYIFGGEFTSPSQSQFYHYRDTWKLNVETNQWTEIQTKGNSPPARSGHRMQLWKRKIILFGGFFDIGSETRYFNDLWAFDIDSEKWSKIEPKNAVSGNVPAPRSGCITGIHGDYFFVLRGYSLEKKTKDSAPKGTVHNDAWAFHLVEQTWERIKTPGRPPSVRSGMSSVVDRTRILTFGGVYDEDTKDNMTSVFYNDMYQFHMDSRRWFPLALNRKRKQKEGEDENKIDDITEEETGEGNETEEKQEPNKNDESEEESEEEEEEEKGKGKGKGKKKGKGKREEPTEEKEEKGKEKGKGKTKGKEKGKGKEKEKEEPTKAKGKGKEKESEKEKGKGKEEEEKDAKKGKGKEKTKDIKKPEESTGLKSSNSAVPNPNTTTTPTPPVPTSPTSSPTPPVPTSPTSPSPTSPSPTSPAPTSPTSPTSPAPTSFTSATTPASPSPSSTPQQAGPKLGLSGDSVEPEVNLGPGPRISSHLAVIGHTLYLYGGVMERGDREIIHNDLYSLNLHKLDTFECLIESQALEWDAGATGDDDEDDEDEEDDEEDSDEEEEEEAEEESEEESESEEVGEKSTPKEALKKEKPEGEEGEKVEGEGEGEEGGEGEEEDSDAEAKVETTASGGTVNVKTKKQLVRGRYGKKEKLKAKLAKFQEEGTPTPNPRETLREFFERTAEGWNPFVIANLKADQHYDIKELRREGFLLAEVRFNSMRPLIEKIEKLEAEEEESRKLAEKKKAYENRSIDVRVKEKLKEKKEKSRR